MQESSECAIAYFHGFPGGPEELSLFGTKPDWASRAFTPDRSADRPDLAAAAYFDDLASRVSCYASGRSLTLVAFSLGARAAMEIAARLGGQVDRVELISPAGPLDGTNHLALMAGRTVFALASSHPRLFRHLTSVQSWIARQRPSLLYRALFGADGEVGLGDDDFRGRVTALLEACFSDGSGGYDREVLAYVAPWSGLPRHIEALTAIWQGANDSWTPPQMAEHLVTLIPQARLSLIPGKGHYGVLRHALATIEI